MFETEVALVGKDDNDVALQQIMYSYQLERVRNNKIKGPPENCKMAV